MLDEGIPSASIAGFGFAGMIRFGFFDHERRDYEPKEFDEREVTALTVTLARKDGKPAIHAHAAAVGRDFRAVGGHLLASPSGAGRSRSPSPFMTVDWSGVTTRKSG